ncbi:hypothetical protein [Methylorubrum sp. GM97]|uniref:hypothetical protein n=1 Tax=Methylorubrum sp. GM97 TaxID=2938232 RepID=UPI0021844F8D|nr:hypothetical protein [Methylorubrum sp. GM97]BDL39009.1 hypothetical protein MSPGM_15990 [Methylorubrum sp. GM97]
MAEMSSRQTWWVAVKQADGTEAEPEVAQVWFNGTGVEEVLLLGNDCGLHADAVRLIERVLPAGRAAAAVEKLEEIVNSSWHVDQSTEGAMEVLDILQGESHGPR